MKNPMRDFLSRLRWDRRLRGRRYIIRYVSRGTPRGYEEVPSDRLVDVTRDGFTYLWHGEEKWIPYHRVIEIKEEATGKVVFSKEKKVYSFEP